MPLLRCSTTTPSTPTDRGEYPDPRTTQPKLIINTGNNETAQAHSETPSWKTNIKVQTVPVHIDPSSH